MVKNSLAVPLEIPPPPLHLGRDAVFVAHCTNEYRDQTRQPAIGWSYLALNIKTGGAVPHQQIYVDGKRTANANDPTADPETPAA